MGEVRMRCTVDDQPNLTKGRVYEFTKPGGYYEFFDDYGYVIGVLPEDCNGKFFEPAMRAPGVFKVETTRGTPFVELTDTPQNYEFWNPYNNTKEPNMAMTRKEKVIFNNPATVVIWEDGTKTIVKCADGDTYDKDKGYLMAYFRKHSGMTKTQVGKFLKGLRGDE